MFTCYLQENGYHVAYLPNAHIEFHYVIFFVAAPKCFIKIYIYFPVFPHDIFGVSGGLGIRFFVLLDLPNVFKKLPGSVSKMHKVWL